MNENMNIAIQNLKKLELHAHLNGSLSVDTLRKLAQMNVTGKNEDWENTEFNLTNLNSCFDIFKIAHNQTRSIEAVKSATIWTIKEFADDNVIYLELRSTPRSEGGMSKRDYILAIIEGIEEAKKESPSIIVQLLISINRSQEINDSNENIKLAIDLKERFPHIITGIDFSGDPTKSKFSSFVGVLEKARSKGLKISVHCGEVANDEEVEDILLFRPDRLGHVTRVSGDAAQKIIQLQIPVELCVTSNLKCRTVSCIEEHQLFKYINRSPFILGTDDKGVFGTSLSNEYKIVAEAFKLPATFFQEMNSKAVDFIFADETTKQLLKASLASFSNSIN